MEICANVTLVLLATLTMNVPLNGLLRGALNRPVVKKLFADKIQICLNVYVHLGIEEIHTLSVKVVTVVMISDFENSYRLISN